MCITEGKLAYNSLNNQWNEVDMKTSRESSSTLHEKSMKLLNKIFGFDVENQSVYTGFFDSIPLSTVLIRSV